MGMAYPRLLRKEEANHIANLVAMALTSGLIDLHLALIPLMRGVCNIKPFVMACQVFRYHLP
jgi:hypothetical protein